MTLGVCGPIAIRHWADGPWAKMWPVHGWCGEVQTTLYTLGYIIPILLPVRWDVDE